ncbi:MAG: hypothetical protein V1904_01120, partial [Bacteroidota bacterium]
TSQPAGHLDITRGRWLEDVINYYLGKSSCGLTLKSQFLFDPINPVLNNVNSIYILNDGSDVKSSGTISSTPAIWNFTTFNKILENLKTILHVQWYRDGNNFVIEHDLFFENGYSYTPNPQTTIDLTGIISKMTDLPEIVKTNKYTYDKGNIYRSEKISNGSFTDFDFSPLIIDYDLQIGKPDNIKTENIDFVLDFAGIYSNPGSYSNDAIVMVACRLEMIDPVNGTFHQVVINEPGYRTNEEVTNGFLCLSNLFNRFWRWQRMLKQGTVNGLIEQFHSETGKILQTVTIQDCNMEYFDQFTHFKTNLGTGRKISCKHNRQLKETELTILI